ncbi:CPBP family intramembrane glutamate endopeptidase [Corynebacterium casei]|uniref:CPBP family intramembrane glutamate endopeptidase n=1 Tax=Corynebacterium casei TaxID=160386 RepID=UPI003F926103
MAEEKQLTVAELLARNAKEREGRAEKRASAKETEGAEAQEAPRRRRRRSLDEGGISVAELTGSIKRVEAEPARSRHSSTSDSPAAVTRASKTTEKPAESKSSEAKAPEAKAPEAKPEAKPAASKPAAPKASEAKAAAKPAADKPAAKAGEKADVKEASKGTAAAKSAEAKPTDAKPAAKASEKIEKKAEKPANDDTTVIQKVDAPAEDSSKAKDAAAGPKAAKTDETTVMPAQPATAATGVKAAEAKTATASPAAKDTESTGEIPVVEDERQPDSAKLAQRDDAELDEAEEDGKLSAVSIVVLALVGIMVGAIVFKGFEVLWGRFDRIIVSILALVVTGAMVGIVHALRTARDAVSMSLAGVVGLILTFGPLLIILL